MIDISNVAMQTIIGEKQGGEKDSITGNSLMATFGDKAKLMELILGQDATVTGKEGNKVDVDFHGKDEIKLLLIAVVVSAVFCFTIFAVAFMLIMRIIMLAIYLVFAAAGYTLAAFPGTRSYSSQWWDGFIKQIILGPILLFGLILAANVLTAVGKDKPFQTAAETAAGGTGGVAFMLQYLVAILLIWTSILASQKIGAEGSGMALGLAQKARGKIQGYAKKGVLGGAKMVGRGADYGMARTTNKMAGSQNKTFSNIGKGLGAIRSLPDRVKNINKNSKEGYANALATSKAHGLSTFGGAIGGDKNAVAIDKGKQIEAEKKRIKEAPQNTAKNIEAEAKAQLLIDKKDGIKEEDITKLIKSLDKLDEDTKKAALKKANNEGYGHLTAAYETDKAMESENQNRRTMDQSPYTAQQHEQVRAAKLKAKLTETYENMDGKTMAKQKVFASYNRASVNSPEYADATAGYEVARDHVDATKKKMSPRDRLDYESAAGKRGRKDDKDTAANKYNNENVSP